MATSSQGAKQKILRADAAGNYLAGMNVPMMSIGGMCMERTFRKRLRL
jgi:hypothetical protein